MAKFWILSIISLGFAVAMVSARGHHHSNVHLIANATKTHGNHSKGAEGKTTHTPTTTPTTTTRRTTPPPPPPPKSCDDDGKCAEKNKKCNSDSKCVCDVHFYEISDGTCVLKPGFGDACFDNATWQWLECYGQGVDQNCYSNEGVQNAKCVCLKGFEPSKTPGDKNCAPITKKLGESCSNDAECFIAYSSCEKGKCTCVEGFESGKDGTCKPKAYYCPTGDAKTPAGKAPATCEVDFNEQGIGDNCGAGSFCFVPPHTLSNLGKPRGHCCPTPASASAAKLICPYGEPLSNATCADKKGGKAGSTCPSLSHQCFAVQQRPHEMICCQNPCRQSVSHFDYNGQCFDYVILGRECSLAAQCADGAECTDSGGSKVCKCKKGYTQTSANQCESTRR